MYSMKRFTFLAISVALLGLGSQVCSAQPSSPSPLSESELVLAKNGTHSYWLPYNAPRYDQETQKFIGYFIQDGKKFRAESDSGLNGSWTNKQTLTGDPATIVKRGNEHYSFDHIWNKDEQWYHHKVLRSANGVDFEKTNDAAIRSGEDFSLLYSEARDEFLCYIRPRPPHGPNQEIRKIGLMTSPDFKKWSAIKTVLEPNKRDHPQLQFYSMSVVYESKRKTYWGFLNVFQVKHDTGEPYPADLMGEDNAVRIQLCRSEDGENWQRCFGQRNFIAPPPDIMEQFAVATIHYDSVHVYVIQSKNRHNIPGPDFYTTVRYKISFEELQKYVSDN
jgi:hypothetical protein